LKDRFKNPFTVKCYPEPGKRAPKSVFVLGRFALHQITEFRKQKTRKYKIQKKNPCNEARRWSYSDIIWLDLKWAGKLLGSVSQLTGRKNK